MTGLSTYDILVLVGYFAVMTLIGLWSMRQVKKQEDYFMGSRGFGKLMQTFAAFGAGTNASDPVVTAKTTFTNGLGGIWSALLWLFVTPFYWIAGVWYRRMRHLTLGDWFTERYQSRSLALAYMVFGLVFYMVYLGVGMTAIGKMGGPIIGTNTLMLFGFAWDVKVLIIVITAVTVLVYGVLGGLKAAYWTDLIQGIFIIILSILLIPVGLNALSQSGQNSKLSQTSAVSSANSSTDSSADSSAVADSSPAVDISANETAVQAGTKNIAENNTENIAENDVELSGQATAQNGAESAKIRDGFRVMHERVPAEFFAIVTSPKSGEFPLHYVIAISLLNLIGIVCQPHFIATGGGAAKTETNARFGLVAGNFLKRFCTIGWALTALIVLALMAGNTELVEDPDCVWGVAARELLGPMNLGLVGLMLACLMAALMSSASCYMLVMSALVVRNGYAAYINPNADDKQCVFLGRFCGAIIILGATITSLLWMNVFDQLKFAWEIPILFAAPFIVGLYWRRANKYSVWGTIVVTLTLFFILPPLLPKLNPDLSVSEKYTQTNDFSVVREKRSAAITDVQRRNAEIQVWEKKAVAEVQNFLKSNADAAKIVGIKPESILAWKDVPESLHSKAVDQLGEAPKTLAQGDEMTDIFKTGGKAIFRTKVVPFDKDGNELVFDVNGKTTAKLIPEEHSVNVKRRVPISPEDSVSLFDEEYSKTDEIAEKRTRSIDRFKSKEELKKLGVELRGTGNFEWDLLLFDAFGWDLTQKSNGTLETLRLPTRLVFPFLFLIALSLITPRPNQEKLDKYYVKMKTPVDPDPETDREEMRKSYENPHRFDHKRLFNFWGLEINRPTKVDIFGFIGSFAICFIIIALIVWVANFQ